MSRKAVSAITLSVLIIGIVASAFNLKPTLFSRVYAREKAPDFTLTDVYGENFSLYKCSASAVLINFFTTVCPPAVQQILVLENIYGSYSRDQLEMISISPEGKDVLRDFAEEYSIEWFIAPDTAGVVDEYGVQYVPTIFIVDAQRYFRYKHIGLMEESILRSEIYSLLIMTATVDINPDTLSLKSKGKWITAYIELPEGYNVAEIDVPATLLNDTVPVDIDGPIGIGDYDEDGIGDLRVKFDRQEVIALLNVGEVTLTITGEVNGIPFEGSDTIRVIGE